MRFCETLIGAPLGTETQGIVTPACFIAHTSNSPSQITIESSIFNLSILKNVFAEPSCVKLFPSTLRHLTA